jgi:hypothetical protein
MKDITKVLKGKIIDLLSGKNQNEGTLEYSTSIKQLIDTYYKYNTLLEAAKQVKFIEPTIFQNSWKTEVVKSRGRPRGPVGNINPQLVDNKITFRKKQKSGTKHTHHKSPVYLSHTIWTNTEVQLLTEAIEQYPPKTTVVELFKLFDYRSNSSVLSKLYKLGGYIKNGLVIKDRSDINEKVKK